MPASGASSQSELNWARRRAAKETSVPERQDISSGLTSLRGAVAVVTGASSGIGEAVAEALAQRGAHVALAARREDRLGALSKRLGESNNGEITSIACDVRQ